MSDPLSETPWANWTRAAIPGDASARRYARLTGPNDQSAIMVVAPSSEETSQRSFVDIARFLFSFGLSVPEILFEDGPTLVLSDLGAKDMATAASLSPNDAPRMYQVACDVLLQLHKIPPPDLQSLTPVVAGEMVRLTAQYYCDAPDDAPRLADAMTEAMARLAPTPDTLALRDFHAENLIWRPEKDGIARLGLLDFQDAFIAPAGYDLVSLVRDARHDVSQEIYDAVVTRFGREAGWSDAQFRVQCACLGVQRNLRILGVFARLARKGEKPRYLKMMPRVWNHMQKDLAHPELQSLAQVVNELVPAPEKAISAWRAA